MNTRAVSNILSCMLLTSLSANAHTLRFVAFDLQVPAGKCQLIPENDPERKSTVELGVSRFSSPLSLPPGSYKLVLPDGKTSGILRLAGNADDKLIVIVTPGPEGSVGVITAPDEIGSFGSGDRMFINVTGSEIRVQFGERNVVCKPGTVQIVKSPKLSEEGRHSVRMAIIKDKDWIVFNSTWWPEDSVSRSLVLLLPNPATGVPGVKTIEEIPVSG